MKNLIIKGENISSSLMIRGGLLIDPASNLEAPRDLLIKSGKIIVVDKPGSIPIKPEYHVLNARRCWVIPGIIDLHVHLREPGREEDETIQTGTRAAAVGGVTSVVAMPNTLPPIDTPSRLRWVLNRSLSQAAVNVLVCSAVTSGQLGEKLAPLAQMAKAGAAAFSDDGRPVMNAELMRRALVLSRELGLPVLDHAEDDHLTGCGVVHEGRYSKARRLPGIPGASETLMALRDVNLAATTGGHLHLCHVSCADTVDVVRRAKENGVKVTAEAAPHHFTLADTDIPGKDPNYKMKPPLRSSRDRAALIAGLADGTLDAIATDHAPHAASKKARGMLKAPFGVIGLETLLPLSLSLLKKGLTRRKLVERLSTGPARVLGLKDKGTLRRGSDADVTVVDPSARRVIDGDFASKSRNSPFVGRSLTGFARATVVGGRLVYAAPEGR